MSKTLVAYFSASGVTAEKAKQLAAATGADLYEIKPAVPYTEADIKWTNPLARCNKEWLKKTAVPLADTDAAVADYDRILLAFPIWYFTAPLIVRSFLNAYNFSGKEIVIFATSGGSNFDKALQQLPSCAPQATFTAGCMLNGDIADEALAVYA